MTLADTRETIVAEEDNGRMMGYDRTYTPVEGAEITLDERDATFEELPYILGAGIAWQTTGTTAGTAGMGGYVYTYTFPSTAQNVTKTLNFEMGDNIQVESTNYGLLREFTLSGAADEPIKMQGVFVGRAITTKADFYGTGVTVPSVETCYFNKGTLYIDDTTMGTTPIAATLVDFSFNVTTGFVPMKTAGGNIAYAHHKQVAPEGTLEMTLEQIAAGAKKELQKSRAGTPRLVRLKFEGAALADTSGGTYTYKSLIINAVGKYTAVEALGDNDGNDVRAFTLQLLENATAGGSSVVLVNDTATYT